MIYPCLPRVSQFFFDEFPSKRPQVAGPGVAGPPGLPSSPSQGIGMDDGGGLMLVPWEKHGKMIDLTKMIDFLWDFMVVKWDLRDLI